GPRGERLERRVAAAAREVVHERQRVAVGGQARGQVAADEARAAQDEDPSHTRSPRTAHPPAAPPPRRGCARSRTAPPGGASRQAARAGPAWRTRGGW